MKKFNDIEGVEDFEQSYNSHIKKFMVEGSVFAEGWTRHVTSFLKDNFVKTKFTSKCKVATIPSGTSFGEIEKFTESLHGIKIEEIVYDNVNNSFTFYGNKK